MLEHTLNREGNRVTLTLKGDLTLPHAGEIKSALLALLQEEAEVAVRVTQADDMDLSSLQLLCAAHRSAATGGRQLTVSFDDGQLFRKVTASAGYIRDKGCTAGTLDSCLWRDGATVSGPTVSATPASGGSEDHR